MDSTATTPQTPVIPEVPITVSDQQNSALLDDTITLLTARPARNSGQQGQAEAERWTAVLAASDRPGLAKIKQELDQLGALLADARSPAHDIAEILASLGAETVKVAEEAGGGYSAPLTNLSKLLIKAASSLSK